MSTEQTLNGGVEATGEVVAQKPKVLGKIELPKPPPQAPVGLLSCSVPDCESPKFREEWAIVPGLKFIEAKVKGKPTAGDVRANVVCPECAKELEKGGIECHRLGSALWYLGQQLEQEEKNARRAKRLEAFVGDYNPKAPRRQQEETPTAPPKDRFGVVEGGGRGFDSPAAKPGQNKRQWQGNKNNNRDRGGWADDRRR